MESPSTDPSLEPPWWEMRKRADSRASIDREAIVTAAIAVLDEAGLEGLSMRRVAAVLGTGAASLYWHVADKDQLIDLVLDRIMGEIELPEPDPEHWEKQIKDFARRARAVFRNHQDVAQASLGRVPMGPNLVRLAEWTLALLRGAGIPDQEAAWFPDLAALIGGAQAVEDHMATTADGAFDTAMGEYLSKLPADRFPNIVATSKALVSGGADERFEFALELLVRGLKTYIDE
ncbi:MAG TPA: TetR/AcrR family transcriptional regulator [Acidimicrobiia bacterium]|nr:TetR/AcrR family transcriptional regulator [Acidimicrobiia bacterium]